MSKSRKQPAAAAPVFAAVGAADLAIEQLKKTLAQVEALADQVRNDLEERIAKANTEAHEAAVRAGKVAHDAPEQVLNQGLSVASLASHAYTEMTVRGQRLVGKGVEDIREDKRVKAATEAAGTTVKVATDTAATVRTLADKVVGKKESGAVTVKGTVVEGETPEATPVKNVRAAADKPATPRKRTPRRATTVDDVTPAADAPVKKAATKRPSRASATSKAGTMKAATTSSDSEVPTPAEAMPAKKPAKRTPRKRAATTKATDPVAASSGNQAATDTAPATTGESSPAVEASSAQAATE